jgi:hypothetical protein
VNRENVKTGAAKHYEGLGRVGTIPNMSRVLGGTKITRPD